MDIAPGDAKVIQHDLAREPLPFEDGICAAVYHSHVLEHIPPDAVPAFIAECRRVLVPGGILRVAVPDLEGIARAYLQQLDSGDLAKHEWMVIELVDQLARHKSGGRMMEYWKQNPMPAEAFVFQRLGNEARQFVERWRANPVASSPPSSDAADVGRFRMGGEVHLWMYDRLSLAQLLREADFTDIRVCAATESAIAGFAAYELDADLAGVVRKPDSLYMEARKPVASA
jgi:SAM-dependent methyltransferase